MDNNLVKNMGSAPYYGGGVTVYGDDVTISNNTFANIGRVGVWLGGYQDIYTGGSNVLVTGNHYTGKGNGDCLDYGIEVGAGGVATITGNTIINCSGVATSDNSTSAGILVTDYYGKGTTATIAGNTLTNNRVGIYVGYNADDTSVVIAHENSIDGNLNYGIRTISTTKTVDAVSNYWGNATGPTHASNPDGEGDAVSDNVDFDPWWRNEDGTAGITVTADDKAKVYDGSVFAAGNYTVSYAGFIPGEGPEDLDGELVFGGTATDAVNVGAYAIVPSGLESADVTVEFVAGTLTIVRADQTINFAAIPDQYVGNVLNLAATASSSLPVSLTNTAGSPVQWLNATSIAFTAAGTVSIVASQAGDANWNAAPNLTNTFRVTVPVTGTLAIEVTPRTGSWTIHNPPAGYVGPRSGTGNLAPIAAAVGTYTVAWGQLSGYEPPAAQVANLLAGQTLVFTGLYVEVSDDLPPAAGVSATDGAHANFIRLTWRGSAMSARGEVISYEIRRSTVNDPSMAIWLANVSATSSATALSDSANASFNNHNAYFSYEDYAVMPGVSYYYWIRARTATQTSRASYVGMGYAAPTQDQTDGTA
ncbi:MAG: MBG domain-containing protein, partial [Kiritimatiellia bacterium]